MDQKNEHDLMLVNAAVSGDSRSLETLIAKHQHWVYNLALFMLGDSCDAEDLTQETMIRMITGLSGFGAKSRFTTWLYRICVNTVYDFRKKAAAGISLSFDQFSEMLDLTPDADLQAFHYSSEEQRLICDEVKSQCLLGMLLCLDMDQRILVVLSDIFNVSHGEICRILDLKGPVLRKRLQRARRQLYFFMNEECGLVNESNSCHCKLKAKALIDQGLVNPRTLTFEKNLYPQVQSIIEQKREEFAGFYDEKCSELLRSRSFFTHYDFVPRLKEIIGSGRFREIMTLNPQQMRGSSQ